MVCGLLTYGWDLYLYIYYSAIPSLHPGFGAPSFPLLYRKNS